jgi:hypothetical protein
VLPPAWAETGEDAGHGWRRVLPPACAETGVTLGTGGWRAPARRTSAGRRPQPVGGAARLGACAAGWPAAGCSGFGSQRLCLQQYICNLHRHRGRSLTDWSLHQFSAAINWESNL